jgi:hypothetical protein
MSNYNAINNSLNRYLFMQNSSITDDSGNFYPDLCTFRIENFDYKRKPSEEVLKQNFVYRFDILTYELYESFDLYDELLLWLNDILELNNTSIGKKIFAPDKQDMDDFYLNNIVGK